MKVFVSYSHKYGEFVWDSLVPVLRAGGADVLIDRDRFKAGLGVLGQMDALQDGAERQILCISAGYLESKPCKHELTRALASDPYFTSGRLLPLLLDSVPLPASIQLPDPIWIDLRDTSNSDAWRLLLEACRAEVGTEVPRWLEIRGALFAELKRYKSVNLVVSNPRVRWRELIDSICEGDITDMPIIDMHDGRTDTRPNLLLLILQKLGARIDSLPKREGDLAEFTRELLALKRPARIAVRNFDEIKRRRYCEPTLFKAWRWLISEPPRPLTLLIQSRTPLSQLQPAADIDSDLASQLTFLELR